MTSSSKTSDLSFAWVSADAPQARVYVNRQRIRKMLGNDPGDHDNYTRRRRAEALQDLPKLARSLQNEINNATSHGFVVVTAGEHHLTYTATAGFSSKLLERVVKGQLTNRFGVDYTQRLPRIEVASNLRWPCDIPTKPTTTSTGFLPRRGCPHAVQDLGVCTKCGEVVGSMTVTTTSTGTDTPRVVMALPGGPRWVGAGSAEARRERDHYIALTAPSTAGTPARKRRPRGSLARGIDQFD